MTTDRQLSAILDWIYDDRHPYTFNSNTVIGIRDSYARTGFFTMNQQRAINNIFKKYRLTI